MNFFEKYSTMEPGRYWNMPKNRRHLIDEYIGSEDYVHMVKRDGNWARAIIWDRKVLIQSRGVSKVTGVYGDYTEKIPHIAAELLNFPDGTVLLGELAFEDLSKNANQVGSVLRSNPDRAIKRQESEGKLTLFVFDILAYNKEEWVELPFEDRFKHLNEFNSLKYVKPVKTVDPKDGSKLLHDVWEAGGEGIILVKRHAPYKTGGAKAWQSIKVKRQLSELEGKVIGVIEPTRVYEGSEIDSWPYWEDGEGNLFTSARFLKGELIKGEYTPVTIPYFHGRKSGVVVEYKGRTIKITSGTTDDDGEFLATKAAAELIKNGQLYAVFTGMELTETSVRHPSLIRLRDDM